MNIYVGNLDFRANENELQSLFEEYGKVTSVNIITDKFSGRSRGFGFIEMENDKEAKKAIDGLNGTTFKDRELTVNEARPRRES